MDHGHAVTSASFSPTGRYLVTCTGTESGDWKARVWETASGRLAATIPGVTEVAFGADDDRILTLERGLSGVGAGVRDWRTNLRLHYFPDANIARWSADWKFVVTEGSASFQVWSAATGRVIIRLWDVDSLAARG